MTNLSDKYKPMNQDRFDKTIARLERMEQFYYVKMHEEEIPVKQAMMFKGFARALRCSIQVFHTHQRLVTDIQKEAKK